MIWATVSSWSYFCWLYRVFPSLAAKNIINLISVLTIWWPLCVESSLVLLEDGVCYDQCIHTSKVVLRILQARLQQYVNWELPDVQAGFRKGRGTRDQIANICWIIEKAREFQKSIYFCFINYAKTFDCVDHNKLWKILREMGIPDHLTCLLRNLYADQEATVKTGWTRNNRLVPNWERSTSRLYIVTLFIYLICSVRYA